MQAASADLPINFVFSHAADNIRTQKFTNKIIQVAKNISNKFKNQECKRYKYQIVALESAWATDVDLANIKQELSNQGIRGIVSTEKVENITKIMLYSIKKIKIKLLVVNGKKWLIRNANLIDKPILFIYNIIVEDKVEEVLTEMAKEIGEIHKIKKTKQPNT